MKISGKSEKLATKFEAKSRFRGEGFNFKRFSLSNKKRPTSN